MKTDKPFYNSTIPSDWTTPEFGEVFTFLKSYSFSREQLSDEKTTDGIQNIHYGDIHATFENEILDFEIEKRIPFVADGLIDKDEIDDEEFPLLKDGDLIIADASEDYEGVAECVELKSVNSRKIVSGLHTFAARDKSGKTVAGYRTYVLRHPQVIRELRRLATGISVYGISKTNLAKVKLPLPPPKEQQAYAELLNLLDTAINKNNQLIAKKELCRNWLMKQLLTGKKSLKINGQGKSQAGTLRKVRIKEIANVFSGGTPSRKNNESYNGTIPWIKSGELNQFEIFSTEEKITEEALRDSSSKKVEKDTILLALYGATAGVVGITRIEAAINQAVLAIVPKENLIDKMYLLRCLQHHMPKAVENLVQGGQPNLSGGIILNYQMSIVDSITEQAKIAEILQISDDEIKLLMNKTIKLRDQKKGIMQQLLTGKKRLSMSN